MNKNNAKDYLPFVQALVEGKTIQVNVGECTERGFVDKWVDAMSELSFVGKPSQYRIKPEPVWAVIVVRQTDGSICSTAICESEEGAHKYANKFSPKGYVFKQIL